MSVKLTALVVSQRKLEGHHLDINTFQCSHHLPQLLGLSCVGKSQRAATLTLYP